MIVGNKNIRNKKEGCRDWTPCREGLKPIEIGSCYTCIKYKEVKVND